jgi:hypothetical protein
MVSHDDRLLERLRLLLSRRPDVVEKPMVGGRSFMVGGRMCCGVTSGGLLVRVGRDALTEALSQPHVSRMSMGGRSLAAFVVVAAQRVATDAELAAWVQRGISVATDEAVPDIPRRARQGAPYSTAPTSPPGPGSAAERFAELVEHFAHQPGVAVPGHGRRRGFGSQALKVDGSIFAMLTREQLVVKMPDTRVAELIDAGTGTPFTAGKAAPMKEWLTVTTDEPSTWLALAREALAFVGKRAR